MSELPSSELQTEDEYRDIAQPFKRRDSHGYPFRAIFEAAESSNPEDLRQLLRAAERLTEGDRRKYILDAMLDAGGNNCSWDTPLLRAIACQRYENIQALLDYGVNRNGIDTGCQDEYSRRFRRVRAANASRHLSVMVDPNSVGPPSTQLLPIMDHELKLRDSTCTRFWIDESTPPLDHAKNGECLHSLVMAANSTPAIFDLLVSAGANKTFWTDVETPEELPSVDAMMPSSLCVATPLHQAISSRNLQMLRAILDRGFNPNARALIAGCQAFTPIQHAIITGNLDAYRVLVEDPRVDTALLTPGYSVHLLHFAVAQLRLDIMDAIQIPLSGARPTALKHNLAHIACLPLEDSHVQLFSSKIKQSIHDLRSLDRDLQPNFVFQHSTHVLQHAIRALQPNCDGPGDPTVDPNGERPFLGLPLQERRSAYGGGTSRWLPAPSIQHFDAQTEILKRLITALGPVILDLRDYCLNTPLHYLACTRIVNNDAVEYVRGVEGGNRVWTQSKNRWGHTPSDLWVDNVTIVEPSLCPGTGRGRCPRHAGLWRGLR